MRMRTGVFLVVLAPLLVSAYGAQRAVADNGDVLVVEPNGTRVRVTSSGVDSEPSLSLDEKSVVFVRKLDDGKSQICIASVKAGDHARVLVQPPLEVNGRRFNQLFSPKFSPDDTMVYFLIPFAATTQAIMKVALADPAPQFVASAISFEVVPHGQYRGDLVVQIRKAKLAPGYYEWYWLITPEGKEIDVVGQDEGDVMLFMEQQE